MGKKQLVIGHSGSGKSRYVVKKAISHKGTVLYLNGLEEIFMTKYDVYNTVRDFERLPVERPARLTKGKKYIINYGQTCGTSLESTISCYVFGGYGDLMHDKNALIIIDDELWTSGKFDENERRMLLWQLSHVKCGIMIVAWDLERILNVRALPEIKDKLYKDIRRHWNIKEFEKPRISVGESGNGMLCGGGDKESFYGKEQNEKSTVIKTTLSNEEQKLYYFLEGIGPTDEGVFINQIWDWTREKLENTHNYIQWMFPTNEQSLYYPEAPILNESLIELMKTNEVLQSLINRNFRTMLIFYGFKVEEVDEHKCRIEKADNFDWIAQNWITPNNHNFLRITRILKSLSLLGSDDKAQAFLYILNNLRSTDYGQIIGDVTYEYWNNSLIKCN